MSTVVRQPVGIPAGITGIRAFEDKPAFIQRSQLLEKHTLKGRCGVLPVAVAPNVSGETTASSVAAWNLRGPGQCTGWHQW
jgi:hypothetical protein